MKNLFFLLVILLFTCHCTTKNESQQHVETMQNLEWLHFSEIKPKGWILHQMTNDLEQGFVGHLDELVPEILVDDDIYGKDRIDTEKSKLGTLGKMWWNSESQSNWWDGYIRHAVLTENEAAMAKAKKIHR